MVPDTLSSEQFITSGLLILSSVIFAVSGTLYTGRAIWKWSVSKTPGYLRWERGFVITALFVALLGLTLLERMLETAGDHILAPAGIVLYLIGVPVLVVSETFFLSRQEWLYSPIVVFVVLAFLAQAFFGVGILRTDLLPGWVGWVTILWNLGWLVILPIVRPKDMYYPWLHYVAPLLIGIVIILGG